MPTHKKSDQDLIDKIERSITSGKYFDAPLETDERVLARVTDGIYRQPWSALREMIANSYDADATTVSISTDAPRFGTLKVSDDGIGMGPEALANLVRHIGGSAKRTQRGPKIGVTSEDDPTRSGKGRRLIGKIGIGLFSVAQLTRQFTIITKTADTDYQLLAHVTLHRPDEAVELGKIDEEGRHTFEAGEVRIWAEKTPDRKGHGTTIHLLKLLPRVIHLLQSRDVWAALDEERLEKKRGARTTRLPPLFHIGRIDADDPATLLQPPQLPWKPESSDPEKFGRLVDGMMAGYKCGNLYARLEHALDSYFQMLWMVGLSLPLEYIEKHPFQLTGTDIPHWFGLPDRRGTTQAEVIEVGPRQAIQSKAKLPPTEDSTPDFSVIIDGVRLFRPIRFQGYPRTNQTLQGPVMFVGYARPDLSRIPESQRGGPLEFVGYFFWTPRLIPQEHNGILVRINGASGTLFDPTFLKYQVGERRLEHVMSEIFVTEGLEGALNIDRESFNTAHPHYQILANWVHSSLHLIRNTLKMIQSSALKVKRASARKASVEALSTTVDALIRDATGDNPDEVPEVVLVADEKAVEEAVGEGKIGYRSDEILLIVNKDKSHAEWIESHASAVARLLEAYGLLKNLDRSQQEQLIGGIVKLFTVGD